MHLLFLSYPTTYNYGVVTAEIDEYIEILSAFALSKLLYYISGVVTAEINEHIEVLSAFALSKLPYYI